MAGGVAGGGEFRLTTLPIVITMAIRDRLLKLETTDTDTGSDRLEKVGLERDWIRDD